MLEQLLAGSGRIARNQFAEAPIVPTIKLRMSER
jgi:hypothetical protein